MKDKALIESTGADEYGFKQFALVFLTEGPNKNIDSTTLAGIQAKHMLHLEDLIKKGKVVLAGPLLADVKIKGLTIFNCSPDEAKSLSDSDPAVLAGHMAVEVYPWYGPATLTNIPEQQKFVETTSIFSLFR